MCPGCVQVLCPVGIKLGQDIVTPLTLCEWVNECVCVCMRARVRVRALRLLSLYRCMLWNEFYLVSPRSWLLAVYRTADLPSSGVESQRWVGPQNNSFCDKTSLSVRVYIFCGESWVASAKAKQITHYPLNQSHTPTLSHSTTHSLTYSLPSWGHEGCGVVFSHKKGYHVKGWWPLEIA